MSSVFDKSTALRDLEEVGLADVAVEERSLRTRRETPWGRTVMVKWRKEIHPVT